MTAPRSDTSDRTYRPDIDALRAVAIVSVVCYHAGVPAITGGFTGVDIFFVISGYLIGGHIFSELMAGSFSYLRFYQRRAKRILPAFFGVMAFVLAATLFLLFPSEASVVARSSIAATLSASNILFWRSSNYFNPDSELNPLLMTWSLGVEEQFYVVIPLLMALLAHIRRSLLFPAILAVCALSFAFACGELNRNPLMVFYMLPARAWELGVGVTLALAEVSWKRNPVHAGLKTIASAIGLALMIVPMFVLTKASPFPGAAALPSVMGTALVIATPAAWINRRLLCVPALAFVGRVSYSWYLWHWPLLAFTRILFWGKLPLAPALLAAALSFVLAVLSYYFIEQPFRRSRRAPGPLLIRYALVSFVALAIWTVLWRSHGLPQRFPVLAAESNPAATEEPRTPCFADVADHAPDMSPFCWSISAGQPAVALVGDSHSQAMAPALRESAFRQGYGFIQLSKGGCMPLIGALRMSPAHPADTANCLRFNESALKLLSADDRIRAVILVSYWGAPFYRGGNYGWLTIDVAHQSQVPTMEASRALFINSLTAFIRTLQNAGKQVFVIEDVPVFDFDPNLRVKSNQIFVRRKLTELLEGPDVASPGWAIPRTDAATESSSSAIKSAMASVPGAELVDVRGKLCNNQGLCTYANHDRLLYNDDNHLSAEGARYALEGFRLPPVASSNRAK